MSQSEILRFPHSSKKHENDPDAAKHARLRIASIPNQYLAHATPAKEDLVGAVHPVSPAAEAGHDPKTRPVPLDAEELSDSEPVKEKRHEKEPAKTPVTAIAANPLETAGVASAPAASLKAAQTMPEASGDPYRKEGSWRSRLPSPVQPLLTGLGVFLLLLLVFKAPIFLSQLNFLTQPKSAATPAGQASAAVPASPTISIPKINVNAPVVYAADNNENDILKDLESGVVHYAGTALPGQPGNSVIFGHSSNDWWEPGNYKFVFVLLDKLQPGDTFTVNYNSKQYLYKVTGSQVVLPTDVGVLAQTPDPEMTLITCTPPGTSWKRLVVTAKQISPAPTSGQTAAPSTVKGNGTLPSNAPSITDKLGGWWHSLTHIFGFGGDSSSKSTQGGGTTGSSTPTTLPATQ